MNATGPDAQDNLPIVHARAFSVAPMIDWTDRHCRYFHRQLSSRALLYTEMITTGALLFGDAERHLRHNNEEHPVALQLGGSDPEALAECTARGIAAGYDEINLNVGCPSDRVQSGRFGACLMAEPELVAACIRAMTTQSNGVPITIKCRIGIDDQDEERDFQRFIDVVADEGGANCFIVHARKAWLQGLSPKENRDIPPLDYERVFRLKQVRPELTVVLNGGLSLATALEVRHKVDGVMLGRAAYQDPSLLTEVDGAFFGLDHTADRFAVVEQMATYAEHQQAAGVPINSVARHMLGLFNGWPGARQWRRYLSENARGPEVTGDVIRQAARLVIAPSACLNSDGTQSA